jgi:uncharacterized membrane protein YkvA (DUF1232 family)
MSNPDRKMGFWKRHRQKVKAQVRDMKLSVLALYLARKDPRIPLKSKIMIVIAVGYVLSPIDLIPDFIPIIGLLDDVLIVPALVGYAVKSIPSEILNEYKEKAKVEFEKGAPKSYKAAIVIVLIWAIILFLTIYWIGKIFWW